MNTLPSSEYPYAKLRALNVSERIEKKNGLSYLSWAFAVDSLLQSDPTANWEYPASTMYGDGTVMVYCAVTAHGKTMTAHLPVMDHRNKPITHPDAFAMNTAMQRCLVKAIALHGLGLYIYAGEDLPGGSDAKAEPEHKVEPAAVEAVVLEFRTAMELDAPEEDTAAAVFAVHSRISTDTDLYCAVGDAMTAKERAAIKACVTAHKKNAAAAYVNGRGR